MDRKSPKTCLVITKSHWEYLKNKADPSKTLHTQENLEDQKKREYYKALDEQSREWRKGWPSSVEEIRAKKEEKKRKQHEKDVAFMKMYKEREREKQKSCLTAIAEAKQKIFNTSCYGVELISALRQSKDLEEREAQIEFNKFVKQKQAEHDKYLDDKIASMPNNLYEYASKHDQAAAKAKQRLAELVAFNKLECERKLRKEAEEKEQHMLGDLEDTRLQQLNIEYDKHEMDHCKAKAMEEIKEYALARKNHREGKRLRDQEDDEIIEICQKYFDRVRCKERKTWQRIIKDKGEESEKTKKVYEIIKTIQENDQKAYDDFIKKGIDEHEARVAKKEIEEKEKEMKADNGHFKQVVEEYNTALEVKEILKHCNKCACERQTWVSKPRDRIIKDVIGGDEGDNHAPKSFLNPNTKLSDALRKRKDEPTPWSGLKGQHKEFAKQAASTLKECKYRHFVGKVVDNYKKTHCSDSAPLPICEY